MYTDEIWGRSGPHSVITITEPVKAKRLEMVDEIKRALEIAEIIPFKYHGPAHRRGRRGVSTCASSTRRFRRWSSSACLRASAACECCWRTFPTSFRRAERLHAVRGTDAPGPELRSSMRATPTWATAWKHEFHIMQDRIRSTHVHDNDGKADKHLFPLVAEGGTIDWKKTMELLRSAQRPVSAAAGVEGDGDLPHPLDDGQRNFRPAGESVSDDSANYVLPKPPRHAGETVRDRRLAVQPAPLRQNRVSDRARRHRH